MPGAKLELIQPPPGERMRNRTPEWTSEQEVLERARGGDLDAFEQLLRAHADRVLAFLVRWIGSRATAEDVFQEAAIRAYVHLHQLRRGGSFRAWLLRIAVNRAKTHIGRQRELPWDGELQSQEVAASAEGQVAASRILSRALGELSAADRQVLLLRFGEELTNAEIGEVLGVPELVVKMRVFRARRRFQAAVRRTEEQ